MRESGRQTGSIVLSLHWEEKCPRASWTLPKGARSSPIFSPECRRPRTRDNRLSDVVLVWRIAADTPDYTADDLSGIGASSSGGRWNRKRAAMVYASSSRALACLE